MSRDLFKTITLNEEINLVNLKMIINNYDDLAPFLTRDFDNRNRKGKGEEDQAFRTYDIITLKGILEKFYKKKLKSNLQTYHYSKSGNGRLFSKEWSLQGIGREIRHTISKGIYYDIDIKNAHPVFLLDYCKKKNIKTEWLDFYVNNRDKCLKEVNDILKYNEVKFDAKTLFLCLINGGKRGFIKDNQNILPEYVYMFSNELDDIVSIICEKYETELYEKNKIIKGKDYYNIKSSTLNKLLCILENETLQCMVEFLGQDHIGALVFDGLMLYITGIEDVNVVLRNLEDNIKNKLDMTLTLTEKPFELALDLSKYDIEHYKKLVETDKLNIDDDDDDIPETDESIGLFILKK